MNIHSHVFINLHYANFFFFFGGTWGSNLGLSPSATPLTLFYEGVFEIGSCELFAQAGFKS
jgi:hypothetical protein